jgi:hypothetical protein
MALQVRLVVLPNGKMQIAIPGGVSFEEAKRRLSGFMKDLGQDVPIVIESQIEQHKHGPDTHRSHHTGSAR